MSWVDHRQHLSSCANGPGIFLRSCNHNSRHGMQPTVTATGHFKSPLNGNFGRNCRSGGTFARLKREPIGASTVTFGENDGKKKDPPGRD